MSLVTKNYSFVKENLGHPLRDVDIGDNLNLIDTAIASCPQTATFVVAASDSLHKTRADYACDGVDDQVEIQEAIAALDATGGVIALLKGTFNISAQISITATSVTLEGAGDGASGLHGVTKLIQSPGSNLSYMIYASGTNTRLRNFLVDGNKGNNPAAGYAIGIMGGGVRNPVVQDVAILNSNDTGLLWKCNGYAMGVYSEYSNHSGFELANGCDSATFVRCSGTGNGMYGWELVSAINNAFFGCVASQNELSGWDIRDQANHNTIVAAYTSKASRYGYVLTNSDGNKILGGIIKDCGRSSDNSFDGIFFQTNSCNNKVIGVDFFKEDEPEDLRYGINVSDVGSINNIFDNNTIEDYGTAPINDLGAFNKTYTFHSGIFMDTLAASANAVHAAITGTGAEQEITTAITNPDVPRNISITNSANSTGDVRIDGVDAKGNTISDTITIVTGGIAYGLVAFATMSKITIPATVANPDTIEVGISDKLGLSNIIYANGDVYKVKVNNADDPTIGTINTTYHTVDCAAINAADNITIWYKSGLNISP